MRVLLIICLAGAMAQAQSSESATGSSAAAGANERPKAVSADGGRSSDAGGSAQPGLAGGLDGFKSRIYPLMTVDVPAARGLRTSLVAFHRVSGENRFVGFLGAASIEVPYSRVAEIVVSTPAAPGGRMRAKFTLHSGKQVKATFDEREGEQLFAGYSSFGRVTLYWRELRHLKFTARTKTTDLPKYGPATGGVDLRLTDRDGVVTELVGFHRTTGDNFIEGLRGASRVEVPLRMVTRVVFSRTRRSPLLIGELELKGRQPVRLRFPRYAEDRIYRGRAEFGDYRIRLGEVRELRVHRSTPRLRDLDPVAAAEGKEIEIGKSKPR